MGTHAVLVNGLDAGTNCSELWSLFGTAGTVTQATTFMAGLNGASAVIFFADLPSAQTAVEHFDSYPYAGALLDVRLADGGSASRLLKALSDLQQLSPGDGWGSTPTPTTAPDVPAAAGPASATSSPVPMPIPFPAVASTATELPSTPALDPAGPPTATPLPEPPAFAGYPPGECLRPSHWIYPKEESEDSGWAAVASRSKAKAQPATAASEPAQADPAAASQPSQAPEWEADSRCRIYITGLRPGVTANDLKAYFSRFGQLLDAAVVPKKHIGFLTFRSGDSGQLCLETTSGTTVPGLSPASGDALCMQYRRMDRVNSFMNTKHPDARDEPTIRLFIGYFPRGTKKEDVRAELSRYGDLTEMMLGGAEDGGDLFCFAQFRRVQDSARAQRAIHGHTLPSLAGNRKLLAAFREPRR